MNEHCERSRRPNVSVCARETELTPLQRALAMAAKPDILSLAMGLPDPLLFPITSIVEATRRVLSSNRRALQYGLPCQGLKERICNYMLSRGVHCSSDCVFLTQGAQQAISLLAKLFLNLHAPFIEEELSYSGFQQLTDIYQPEVLTVPTNAKSGLDVEAVESILVGGARPAFMYLMPNAHNPLGVTISREKRNQLAYLARQFEVPIIEDDPYGALFYDTEPIPPIWSLDSEWVYYVGSFSKMLAPSLRVGWIIAPKQHMRALSVLKEGSDLDVSTLSQWVVDEILDKEDIAAHLNCIRSSYREKRMTMDRALQANMPQSVRWEVPSGGVFFWIDLPESLDASRVLASCIKDEKVAFLPAQAFSRNKRTNGMRLNFSHSNSLQIEEAIRRIGRVVGSLIE